MAQFEQIFQYDVAPLTELDAADRALCEAAVAATALAYAPYSGFHVGAAARLVGAEVLVRAANLENAAFPQCLCAEASLLATVHSQYAGRIIEAIAIAVRQQGFAPPVAAPCGSCRQQLFEAQARQAGAAIRLLLVGPRDEIYTFARVSDLLPFGFTLQV